MVKNLRPGNRILLTTEDPAPHEIIEIQPSIDMRFYDITIETGELKRLPVDSLVIQVGHAAYQSLSVVG